jgi:SAM-dependent methyltransferase
VKRLNWNTIAQQYSAIDDARRDTVFPFILDRLRQINPNALLDYGGGDGKFATQCASLLIRKIRIFDTSPSMLELARRECSRFPQIEILASTKDLSEGSFDVITFNAVWMSLINEASCLDTLSEIHRLLQRDGRFIASVTHPCFRTYPFSTFQAEFDPRDYLIDGKQFNVTVFDGTSKVVIRDTHWSLTAMSNQLKTSGFAIDELAELPDRSGQVSKGSPWLVVLAKKYC